MMMKNIGQILTLSAVLGLLVSSATAETSQFRLGVQQASAQGAFNGSVDVLARQEARGGKQVRDAILAELDADPEVGATRREGMRNVLVRDGNAWAEGPGWALEVAQNGDRIKYRDLRRWDGDGLTAIEFSDRALLAGHVEQARTAAGRILGGVLNLGPTERLRHWYTAFRRIGSRNRSGAVIEDSIDLVRVVFTREIKGVPVLGDGSKVSMVLDIGGNVVGFDVNWASFGGKVDGESEKGASSAAVQSRKKALGGRESTNETSFECGYYDSGVPELTPELRLACVVTEDSTSSSPPRVYAIPAAEDVPSADHWPEARALRAQGSELGARL